MRRLLILLLPLASLCACREKARTGQDPAVPEEKREVSSDTRERRSSDRHEEPSAPEPPVTASPERRSSDRHEQSLNARDHQAVPHGPQGEVGSDQPERSLDAGQKTGDPGINRLSPPASDDRAVSSALSGPERAKAAAARVRPELEKALAAKGLRFGDPVFIRAFKEEGQVELWVRKRDTGKYEHFRTWDVAAQSGKPGPKLAEGDSQVPEGFYYVPPSAMKPDSTFHLAFNIGYPNAYDRHHGRTGTFIMIHGNRVSIGCLAMTDPKIEEIYTLCDAALKNGQPYFRVNLFPFRMAAGRLAREKDNEWFDFWTNLKEGYDRFEHTHLPPEADVKDGRYVFK